MLLRLERLPLVWAVFLLVPPLWAAANLAGTTCRYATVEGFTAGWRNASVGIAEAYGDSDWLFKEFTPCCALIALGAMVWPRRVRWWVAAALLIWLGWLSWNSVPAWHRHLDRDAPSRLFLLVSAVLVASRGMHMSAVERIARLRTAGP